MVETTGLKVQRGLERRFRQTENHLFSDLPFPRPCPSQNEVPLVLVRDVINEPRLENCSNRHGDFFGLYIVQQGHGVHVIDGVPYGVARGDVYLMGAGATHTYTDSGGLVLDAAYFTPSIFSAPMQRYMDVSSGFLELLSTDAFERRNGRSHWIHLNPTMHDTIVGMFMELRDEWECGGEAGDVLISSLLFRLLVHLSRYEDEARAEHSGKKLSGKNRPSHSAERNSVVASAVHYIDSHFSDPIRLGDIASGTYLSSDRLTALFGSVMGQTPRDYIRYLRVERAKLLLVTSDLSVSSVGANSGFSEAPYFSRVFREATGMTPTEYRKSNPSGARK